MKDASIVVNELKLIENIDLIFDNKIVLYGAGYHGTETMRLLKTIGIQDICFCDSNARKWDTDIDGVKVISPDILKQYDAMEELLVLVTSEVGAYIDQIINTIMQLGLRTENIFTKLALDISLIQNINNSRINESYRSYFLKSFNYMKFRTSFQTPPDIMKLLEMTKRMIKNADNILIYQPGKVGSSTIVKSLEAIGTNCIHIHSINRLHVPAFFETKSSFYEEYIAWAKSIWSTFKEQETIKVITLIREPISWSLAFSFNHLDKSIYSGITPGTSFFNSYTIKRLNNYNSLFWQFSWFEKEWNAIFDIDIYTHPFDKEKGYSIIKQGNVEVLIIKLEKLNGLEHVIGDFVGAPHFRLENDNVTDIKTYKYLYQNAKDSFRIPKDIVASCYSDCRLTHFYTEDEIAGFWKKWEKNIEG